MDLEDHVLGIFKQVSCQIIKSLQHEACLPVMPKDGKSSKEPIVWAIPSCIIHSQEHVVKVISQNMLEEKLGLFYLNKDVDGAISKRVLTSLGVRKITLEQLLEICRAVVHQFNVSVQSEEVFLMLQFCLCFYDAIVFIVVSVIFFFVRVYKCFLFVCKGCVNVFCLKGVQMFFVGKGCVNVLNSFLGYCLKAKDFKQLPKKLF